jgi:hypothetical protein
MIIKLFILKLRNVIRIGLLLECVIRILLFPKRICLILGHGGYMISANGGTWSNNNPDFNNKVKVIFIFIIGI